MVLKYNHAVRQKGLGVILITHNVRHAYAVVSTILSCTTSCIDNEIDTQASLWHTQNRKMYQLLSFFLFDLSQRINYMPEKAGSFVT
jgi:hypothetical protein